MNVLKYTFLVWKSGLKKTDSELWGANLTISYARAVVLNLCLANRLPSRDYMVALMGGLYRLFIGQRIFSK